MFDDNPGWNVKIETANHLWKIFLKNSKEVSETWND